MRLTVAEAIARTIESDDILSSDWLTAIVFERKNERNYSSTCQLAYYILIHQGMNNLKVQNG